MDSLNTYALEKALASFKRSINEDKATSVYETALIFYDDAQQLLIKLKNTDVL